MHDEADRERVAALIPGAGAQAERLAAVLGDRCWPGGAADRTEPAARAWLSHWRPERLAAVVVHCTCRQGPCLLCN